MRAEKEALRASMRDRLAAMPGEEREPRSRAVCRRVESLAAFAASRTVMVYLVMRRWREPGRAAEVSCEGVIEACRAAGKRVCAPRIDWASRLMTPALLAPGEATEIRYYDVPEPTAGAMAVTPEEIDMVLVPGLAFDRERRRLGRGAGFYDRFLESELGSRSPGSPTVTVGLAFDAQVVDRAPAEPHDRPVDVVATESGVFGG